MFIRNCVEAKALMELIWLYDADVDNNTWEQFSLRYLVDNFPEVRRQILVESNPKEFNSFPLERGIFYPTVAAHCWSRGDFICHFSGIREPYLQSYIERYSRALSAYEGCAYIPALKRVSEPHEAKDCAETHGGGTVTFSQLGELGQFGNQLFQIAAALGYGARHNARVLLPHWRCGLRQRDYGRLFSGVNKYCGASPKSVLHHELSLAYSDIPYQEHIDLRGYFQCERYFVNIREQIVQLFAEPQAINAELESFCRAKQLREFDAIHFRCFSHPESDRGLSGGQRLLQQFALALRVQTRWQRGADARGWKLPARLLGRRRSGHQRGFE